MIPITNPSNKELQEIRIACAYLFSPEFANQNDFLSKLRPDTVNAAFREKVQRYDPGLHRDEPEGILRKRKERFKKIKESYQILKFYFHDKKDYVSERSNMPAKIIAIGGAKGGIGKSVFVANLGTLLASNGKRAVLVDLDLGGANLHLYLGVTALKNNINDFLNKRVPTLEDIMVSTKYGPYLIGGDSSQLGAANIDFLRKLKLLRAIKKIDADYILIDLGGETSYNVIDFFLFADRGIVLTTCEPASYLEAYSFIKVALYRKLDRIFGPESEFRTQKDSELEQVIKETKRSLNGTRAKLVEELIQRVSVEQPRNLTLIRKVLDTFHPYIIGNMIEAGSGIEDVVHRIQDVSQKMLSIQVGYLVGIPYQPEIKSSVHELVPVVAKRATRNAI